MKAKIFFTASIILAALLCSCGGGLTGGKSIPWPTDIEYVLENAAYGQSGKIVKIDQPDPAENYDVASTIIYISGAALEGINKYITQLIDAGYRPYQCDGATSIEMPDPDAWMPNTWQGRDANREIMIRIVLSGEKDEEDGGTKSNLKLIFFKE